MPSELERVLWDLDDHEGEPSVIVDPSIEAFCLVRAREERGTDPPKSERLPLDVILRYMSQNRG